MIRKTLSVLVSLLIIAGSVLAIMNTQNIIDWWTLRDYHPSQQVSDLVVNSGMNDYGRKLFYVHDPAVLSKQDFKGKCDKGEASIVLGCYISRQNIYLLDVEDERLEGVEEVTAAHEMLHAAFDRLSNDEKEEITKLLTSAYANIEDKRIRSTVGVYESRGADVVANELHSILATEVAELPSLLEEHYSQYFSDRASVVALAEEYADEFTRREEQIQDYDNQLSDIKGDIARTEAEVLAESKFLESERSRIEGMDVNEVGVPLFNSEVKSFNSKIASYNQDLKKLNALYSTHDDIVRKRNAIAHEERELIDAIDASVTPL